MILKPTKKGLRNKESMQNQPQQTPKKGKRENKLPSDEYKPMFDPIRILVRETYSQKNPMSKVKQYVELSVKRFQNDDENAPMVYMQMYQEAESYTGYLKGKTIYFPLEMLYDMMDNLTDISEKCDELGIE